MKVFGLLKKDVYELWAQSKALLLLIALYLVVPIFTGSAEMTAMSNVAILLCAMLPVNTISYDERSGWTRYVRAMPVADEEIKLSKYLLGFCGVLGAGAVQLLLALALGRYELLLPVVVMVGMASAYLMLAIPLVFRFGAEKGRMYLLMLTGFFAVCAGFLADKLAR